jgi:transcriptional regulator with XRE-family HTH domain
MRLLGAKVREARRQRGLSRSAVAERAASEAINEATIASIEAQREVQCDEEFVDALARALDCAARSLTDGESDASDGAAMVVEVSSATRARDAVERESDGKGPLERAIDAAFDGNDHIAQDRFSVDAALRYVPVGFIAPREIVGVARAWLDAAAVLREHGVVPTFTTLVACVAALEGFAGEHAQRLLARAKEAGALDGEPAGGR